MLIACAAAIGAGHRDGKTNWTFPDMQKQSEWSGLCKSGMRQSPINLILADTATRFGDFQLRGNAFRNMPNKTLKKESNEMWMNLDEGFVWATGKDGKNVNYRPFEFSIKSPSEH